MQEVVLCCVRESVRSMGIAKDPNFDSHTIDLDTDLAEVGVDSFIVGELHARLQKETGLSIDMAIYDDARTATDIARALEGQNRGRSLPLRTPPVAVTPAPDADTTPLISNQQDETNEAATLVLKETSGRDSKLKQTFVEGGIDGMCEHVCHTVQVWLFGTRHKY